MALPPDPSVRQRSPEHWVLLTFVCAGLLALVALGLFVEPDPRGFGTHEQLGLDPCRFLAVTGLPCPGCGVTTSIAHAIRGNMVASFDIQPFGLVVLALLPVAAVIAIAQHARGRDLGDVLRAARVGWWAVTLGLVALAAWAWKIAVMHAVG